MWKSTDAGLTWQYVYGLQNHIRVTHFDCEEMIWIDENNAYLLGFDVDPFGVGPSGYKTTDGGLTWTGIDSLLQSSVYTADFLDASNGWIQFSQTDTAYTTNGGDSWTVVPVPGNGLNDFDMVNATIGYGVGVLGETYKTTNGGRTWSLLAPMNQAEDYYEVKAISTTEAILIGRDNTDQTHFRFFTRRTANGGQTWTRSNLPDDWNNRYLHPYHLDARPDNKVWVAGLGGVIASNAPLPTCPADLDNGSGAGTRDGAITIDDLLFFLNAFEGGATSADLDNGTSTGTPDGAVTIEDLLFFLVRFEAGC
jgi:photosystem II stability/assembly factor-like uncharacterized protein